VVCGRVRRVWVGRGVKVLHKLGGAGERGGAGCAGLRLTLACSCQLNQANLFVCTGATDSERQQILRRSEGFHLRPWQVAAPGQRVIARVRASVVVARSRRQGLK